MIKDQQLIKEILQFWFSDEVQPFWFNSTAAFDDELKQNYEKIWGLARTGMYDHWGQEADGALALVIILDQFPLNMFREDARQYSTEAHARQIARAAIDSGLDMELSDNQTSFIYLPFMHSESIEDQDYAVSLYEKAGLSSNLEYARHHRSVVMRFNRFPHRNEVLGRKSSEEEVEYLKNAKW